jgi:CubicO group peptidase (beta-lactamase class C family)
LLTGCAADPPADVDRPDATTAQVVSRVAQRYLDETPLVGLSVAVARDGRIVHESGYGLARRAPDLAADATVPFELFSIAKPVTAVLLLRLAERGLVDLDQASGTYVQGLPPEYASATLRQLLRHSSGVAEIVIDELDPDPSVRTCTVERRRARVARDRQTISRAGRDVDLRVLRLRRIQDRRRGCDTAAAR